MTPEWMGRTARRSGVVAALLAIALSLAALDAEPARARDARAPLGSVLRIYLARHGQTDWNAAHRLQGSIDTHLNAQGREQAAALAKRLAGIRFDAVYSSTLSRTRETAAIVHGRVPIDSLPGLNERRMGRFQGVVRDSDSTLAAEFDRRLNTPGDDLDGGETREQHFARVSAALDRIRRQHPAGTVLVVGHGGTNQMLLKALLGLTWDQTTAINQGNDELYMIEIEPGVPPRLWKWVGESNLKDL